MREVWLPVYGYTSLYEVSSLGRVNGLFLNKFLKGSPDKDGYIQVCLRKNCVKKYFRVHRLVAKAFIPNPLKLPIVHHKNNVKDDNLKTNLQWFSYSQNVQHAFDTGRILPTTGTRNGMSLFTDKDILKIRKLYSSGGYTQKILAKLFCASRASICLIVNRKQWKHI